MIGLALKLLGLGRWLKALVTRLFTWLVSDIRNLALFALGLSLAWNYFALGISRAKLADCSSERAALEQDILVEAAAHTETKLAYAAAQQAATALAMEVKDDVETQWKDAGHDIEQDLRTRLDRALDDAARLRSKPRDSASPRAPSGPDLAGPATSAADLERAGALSVMDDRDVQICTENTVKAEGWQEYHAALTEALNPQ